MVSIQRVATISGAIFIVVGLLGFTPAGMGVMQMGAGGPALLLGIFPVNVLHNVVHILFGVWCVLAGRSASGSVVYALGSGAMYLLLGVMGVFTDNLLGIVPIGGYDVYLHLALAVVLAGCGFWAMWFTSSDTSARR